MKRSLLLVAVELVACTSPTAQCGDASGIAGTWTYRAAQETPVRGTATGSLTVSSVNCTDFQGVLDVVETLATGASRRIAGQVSGTLVDGALVQFEATLGGGSREHLARLAGDSLTGNWIEASGMAAGSGTFGSRRQAP